MTFRTSTRLPALIAAGVALLLVAGWFALPAPSPERAVAARAAEPAPMAAADNEPAPLAAADAEPAPMAAADAEPEAEQVVQDLMRERGVSREVAAERIGWQSKTGELESRMQDRLGARFGGVWIGQDDDRVKVGVVGGAGVEVGSEAGVDFVPVARSWNRLEEAHAWLVERLEDANDGSTGRLGASIKVDANTVELQTAQGSAPTAAQRALVAAARSRFGDAISSVEAPAAPRAAGCGHTYCDGHVRGGVRISSHGTFCTGGFFVRDVQTGAPYLMTAGHCLTKARTDAWWKRGSEKSSWVGAKGKYVVDRRGDVGILRLYGGVPAWPAVYVGGSRTGTKRTQAYRISGVGRSVVGARVCHTGATTGTKCGRVTRVRQTVHPIDLPMSTDVTVASFCVRPGDSGGPVFASGRAYGILNGGWRSPCGTNVTWGAWYTEMGRAQHLMQTRMG